MHRKLQRMALVLTLLSVGVLFVSHAPLAHAATTPDVGSYSPFYHIFGGFSIDTPAMASAAAGDGISEAQIYGKAATTADPLGQTFQSLHMHEVDSYLWALLYEYECHRSHVVPHTGASCKEDYPFMTSVSVLLSLVQSHLQQVAGNALVNAYWVLDDWPAWDYGGARTILQQIRALIHQYTPNRPAICGFGAEIELGMLIIGLIVSRIIFRHKGAIWLGCTSTLPTSPRHISLRTFLIGLCRRYYPRYSPAWAREDGIL